MKFDVKSLFHKGLFSLKKNSPQILVVTGVGGMIFSGVMACKATRKLEPVLEEHKNKLEIAHKYHEGEKKEITKVYAETGLELAKLYAGPVIVCALSATGIFAGTNVLRKRNIALATAYAALDTSYKTYRSRVVDRFGKDVDHEIVTGSHQEKIEVVETDENGKEKKVKKTITVMGEGLSPYARYFAYGEALAAETNAQYNEMFLKAQQELANHILAANGYLFLNDVYKMLGMKESITGQVVGWIYDKYDNDSGDNYVDFRIEKVYRKRSDAPGDYEEVFIVDPNVDGDIWENIRKRGLITE